MPYYKDLKCIMKIIKKKEEYQRDRFHNMTNEKRDRLNEYRRAWYCKLDEEKKNKIRKDARDRYYAIKVC